MPARPILHQLRRLGTALRQGLASLLPFAEPPSEGDLRAREQRLRLALTAAGLGVFEHLLRDRRTLVTPEFCQIFGLPLQSSLPEDERMERVHPDDRLLVQASVQQMLQEQTALSFEHRICLPSGGVRWVHTMAAPLSVNGTVESIHGVVQDITERKQVESKLRQFSRAVEQSPASVMITDPQGRIEYVNPKFCQVTGYDLGEVLGKNPGLLKSGDMPTENYQQMWAALTAGREWHGEFHNRKKNGGAFWESASISPVRDADGKITHFIAVKEDITAAKLAAQELAEAKQFLDRIIDTVGDPIFVKDRQHRFAVVNTSLCNLVHQPRQDLLGRTDRDFFPPEQVEVFWDRDEQIFITGTESIHEETLTDADGQVHSIVTRKNLHRNEHGELFLVGVIHDVTDRKRALQKLVDSKNFLDRIINTVGEPIYVLDRQHRWVEMNDANCSLLGRPRQDLLGKSLHDVLPRAEADALLAMDDLVFQTGKESIHEETITDHAGHTHLILTHRNLYLNETGEMFIVGTLHDITQTKNLEAALLESDRRQKAILDNIPDPAWLKDARGRYLVVNQPLARLYGHPPDRLIGKTMFEIVPEFAGQFLHGDQEAIRSGKSVRTENCLKDAAGVSHWFDIIRSPIFNPLGELTGIAGIARDITAHKQTESELRQFARAVEQSPVSVVITDTHGHIEYVNPKFCQVTGYSHDEVIGKNPRVLKSGDMPPEAYRQMWAAIKAGAEWHGEFHNRKKNGELYWEAASISPIRGPDWNITHFIAIKEDITRYKNLESALRQSDHRQKAILDNIPDPAWLKDPQGRFLAVNQAMRSRAGVFGHSLEKAGGQTISEIAPEFAAEFVKRDQQVLLSGKSVCSEESLTDPEGKTHWFEIIRSPIIDENGTLTGIAGIARDITARRQTDQTQKEQLALRELLSKTAANTPGIIFSYRLRPDGSTSFPYISPTVEAFCGVRAETLNVNAAPLLNLLPREERARIRQSREESARKILPWREEFMMCHPARGLIWVEAQSTPEQEADGSILWHGFMSDITERKQAETALRDSEEKFRQLADNIADVFWMTSPDLNAMHYVSAGYAAVWGRSRENLYADPEQWTQAILPADRERTAAAFATLLNGETAVSVEYQITRPDGAIRWIHDRGFPVRDAAGHLLRIAGLASDITDRKRLEMQMEHLRCEQKLILDNLGEGLHWIDVEGRIKYENPAAARMLGYEVNELLDQPAHETMHHSRPDGSKYPTEECPINATLRDRLPRRVTDEVFWRKDGTCFPVEYTCTPALEKDGRPGGTVVIFSDVTARQQAQAELENLARKATEHKLMEERSRRELEREHALSQVKSRFVSLVSHEFRTPLSAINMAAFLLSDYAEGMSAEERAAHTRDIQNAVGRMTTMMEDFLIHEKVQSGSLKCQPAKLNLDLFCRDLIPEVQHSISPLRPIECTIDPAVREVFLDERILRHVLGNLLSNAVKYSADGQTVTFTARPVTGDTPSAELPETFTEDQLQLQITDSGIGIPQADLPKLFHTFHRAANVGNRPGSGMGLAIVKQFVDLHRGTIRVESQEGQGTTVSVWLPLGEVKVAAGLPPAVESGLLPPDPVPAPPSSLSNR